MNDEADVLDRKVAQLLQARLDVAADPLPWDSVMHRHVGAGPVAPAPQRSAIGTRWFLAAASLVLVGGVIAGLSTIVGQDDPAVTELPPPGLEEIDVDTVGPTRTLSSIMPGEVVVPTLLFSELVLEPVIVYDEWRSQWFAHTGVRDASGVMINVSTSMDGEPFGSPDVELTAGGTDWAIRTFGAGQHRAFARFDRLAVFVSVDGIGLSDLEVLLGGLRAGDPQAHPASTYAESGGAQVAMSANGEYRLFAAPVGEWLCSTVSPVLASPTLSSCVIPAPQDDGSMLISSRVSSSPVDGDADNPDEPRLTTVFAAGLVPSDAIGAEITHIDGSTAFARAGERSSRFDVRFVLDIAIFDDPDAADYADLREREQVGLHAVFDD